MYLRPWAPRLLAGGPGSPWLMSRSALPDGLRTMTDWLRGHGVTAAALEGTGVYWQAPFEALEDAGILAGLTCHVQAKLEPLARVLAATLDPLVLLTLQVEAVDRADAAIVALDTRIRDALADYQRPLRLL